MHNGDRWTVIGVRRNGKVDVRRWGARVASFVCDAHRALEHALPNLDLFLIAQHAMAPISLRTFDRRGRRRHVALSIRDAARSATQMIGGIAALIDPVDYTFSLVSFSIYPRIFMIVNNMERFGVVVSSGV